MIRSLLLAGLLGGCALEEILEAGPDEMLATTVSDERSTAAGKLFVDVPIADGVTAFLVTAEAEDEENRLALVGITDPSGAVVLDAADWFFSPQTLTTSFYGDGPLVTSQWPIRQEDGPITPGTWTVELSASEDDASIAVTTLAKADPDFALGVVDVQIIWAEGVEAEPGVLAAVEVAVERWRTIWADRGLTLRETYVTSSIDPNLAVYPDGNLAILHAAEDATGHSLQVIIGDLVAGDRALYGVAAGIPGTVVPTRKTYVLVSWLVHAGFDGTFDTFEEKRIFGETLAHETGHFMGLVHPVEVGWGWFDALLDTDECPSQGSCQTDLGDNLMFPYPVCTGYAEDCLQQGTITLDQKRVLQQY
nr:hypothetical protein [Deltaproteobacteria bacterium]